MGTQQILLIVLSVIIVGVAIAVGISMFNSQAYNANKTAIASDAQAFAAQVLQYWKTPESQGGAGGNGANMSVENVTNYLGLTGENAENENGSYVITAADSTTVEITGVGTAIRNDMRPQIVTTVTLATDGVTAVATDEAVE
ncbi:MAG: hypothetical protein PHY21_08975 [Candidatus Cloacimonetes bacterium]|nr:hypothetical protein [Candidatus Cloacimonadota bacterium]MDD2684238.1 hypothetical protein [Candidatus Cloacimonadota bacterium]